MKKGKVSKKQQPDQTPEHRTRSQWGLNAVITKVPHEDFVFNWT